MLHKGQLFAYWCWLYVGGLGLAAVVLATVAIPLGVWYCQDFVKEPYCVSAISIVVAAVLAFLGLVMLLLGLIAVLLSAINVIPRRDGTLLALSLFAVLIPVIGYGSGLWDIEYLVWIWLAATGYSAVLLLVPLGRFRGWFRSGRAARQSEHVQEQELGQQPPSGRPQSLN